MSHVVMYKYPNMVILAMGNGWSTGLLEVTTCKLLVLHTLRVVNFTVFLATCHSRKLNPKQVLRFSHIKPGTV